MKRHFSNPVLLDLLFLGPMLLALFIFKIPQLSLPGFWDEAWSYLPAILKMAGTGPALLPDPQTAELFRGHPLLFYAIASLWIKLFGHSFVAMRLLPLLISMTLLVVLYLFSQKHFGRKTAIITVMFLAIQSVFLAQSSLLLPEMILALLSLLALDAFISGRKGRFILWGTLLVLTKETGIILVISCLLISVWENHRRSQDQPVGSFLRSFGYLGVPLVVIALFFCLQKVIMGWFFFPEHIGLVDVSAASVFNRLSGYSSYLFIGFGRNMLTFTAGAALIYLLFRKIRPEKKQQKVLFILVLFTTLYILFLSVNFYSPRYLLSVLPLFILVCVSGILKATEKSPLFSYLIVLAVFANNLWFTWDYRKDADHNLGYADAVEVQRQAIGYCGAQRWQDRNITTHFLMRHYLTHAAAGYVKPGLEFRHVSSVLSDSTEIAVITSTEYSNDFRKGIERSDFVLAERFEKRGSWAEVYRKR